MTEYEEIAGHFTRDFAEARQVVCREDGLRRHLEFSAPRSMGRLVIVTWPYNLLVAGSHGSFHFERYGPDTEDMLVWLRGARVSPSSWASKLINGYDSVRRYDAKRLEAAVKERVAEAVKDGWAPDGLETAVRQEILDSHWMSDEQNALRLVSEFQLGLQYRSECSCGESAEHNSYSSAVCWNALTHHGSGPKHKVKVRQTGGFTFDDFTEWNIHGLDYHFVYQCHALVWAIARYDEAKAAEPAFFQTGRVYGREEHGRRVEFRVCSIDTSPDGEVRVARGWRIDCDRIWEPTDTDDMDGWTDITDRAGAVESVGLPA